MYKGLRNPMILMNFLTGSRFVRALYAAERRYSFRLIQNGTNSLTVI
jgi:hypothetical protein